jgi:hypothetical protein
MYVRRSIVESSTNRFCRENATVLSVFIVVVVDINNIKVFIFSMEIQIWVPFEKLYCYKIFLNADNNNKYYAF